MTILLVFHICISFLIISLNVFSVEIQTRERRKKTTVFSSLTTFFQFPLVFVISSWYIMGYNGNSGAYMSIILIPFATSVFLTVKSIITTVEEFEEDATPQPK